MIQPFHAVRFVRRSGGQRSVSYPRINRHIRISRIILRRTVDTVDGTVLPLPRFVGRWRWRRRWRARQIDCFVFVMLISIGRMGKRVFIHLLVIRLHVDGFKRIRTVVDAIGRWWWWCCCCWSGRKRWEKKGTEVMRRRGVSIE